MWSGDQLTSWDQFDGLGSAVRSYLSGGMSGLVHGHSDVGGYTMVEQDGFQYVRSAELLVRWAEMSCVADAMLRTHPGNLPSRSAQVYSNASGTLSSDLTGLQFRGCWEEGGSCAVRLYAEPGP